MTAMSMKSIAKMIETVKMFGRGLADRNWFGSFIGCVDTIALHHTAFAVVSQHFRDATVRFGSANPEFRDVSAIAGDLQEVPVPKSVVVTDRNGDEISISADDQNFAFSRG